MTDIKHRALDWAERNSSPGIAGRDDTYEFLITIQAEAYEAGYRKALEDATKQCDVTIRALAD